MKRLISVLALILLFSFTLVSAAQENPLNLKKCDTEFPGAGYIRCLSKNSNGDIAMVLSSEKINVYNSQGEFLYSYSVSYPNMKGFTAGFTKEDDLWVKSWETIYIYIAKMVFYKEHKRWTISVTQRKRICTTSLDETKK